MNVSQKLQAIFEAEVERIYAMTTEGPLDAADISKLERLVSAYSKYQEKNFKDESEFAGLTAEQLRAQLRSHDSPRQDPPKADQISVVEDGGLEFPPGRNADRNAGRLGQG